MNPKLLNLRLKNPTLHPVIGSTPTRLRGSVSKLILAVGVLPLLLSAQAVRGSTVTWTGSAGTVNWADSGNWAGGNVSSNVITFDATAGSTTLSNNLAAGTTVAGIIYTGAASAYTLQGNSFTLSGNITGSNGSSSVQTINNDIVLSNGGHIISSSTNSGAMIVLNGNISGAGSASSISISGNAGSTVVLTGNNTFAGGVSTGDNRVLKLGSDTALGTGTLTLGGSTLDNIANKDLTLANVLSQGKTIANFSNSTGNVTFTNGVVLTSSSATWNVLANTLTLKGSLLASTAATSSTFTKSGTGSLVMTDGFSTPNNTAITMVVSAGTLQIGNANAFGSASSGKLLLGSNNYTTTFDMAVDTSIAAYNVSTPNLNPGVVQFISNRATAGAGITHTLGSLTLGSGNGAVINFYAGSNVTSGTASVAFGAVYATNCYTVTLAPYSATVILDSLTSVVGSNNTAGTTVVDLSGTSQGTIKGTVTENGVYKLGINKSNTSIWVISGSTSYSGNTKISGGVLQFANADYISSNSLVQLNGGILQTSGTLNRTLSSKIAWYPAGGGGGFSAYGDKLTVNLAGASEIAWGTGATNINGTLMFGSSSANAETEFQNNIDLIGATRTIDVASGAGGDFATISGNIRTSTGTAGITKTGNGRLVLSGSNTYNGATTVNGGQLDINSSLSASSAVTVNAGASLGGTGVVNGSVTVIGGGIKGTGLNIVGSANFTGTSSITGTNTISGGIMANSGIVSLSGVNTGNATVASTATLRNNGLLTGNVAVSGTYKGTGTVSGALDIKSGGLFMIGSDTHGIAIVSGSLTVESGAKLSLLIGGAGTAGLDYDQVVVNGGASLVKLGSTSVLELTSLSLTTGSVTLIANHSDHAFDGRFGSVIIGSDTFDVSTSGTFGYAGTIYELSYTANTDNGAFGNDLVLTVVPEPATWAMLLGGMGALVMGQHLRRRP